MALPLKSHFFSLLVFLLEKLVYLENWWYEASWSYWRPSRTTTLDKLVKSIEDEIWHAVIFGKDGDVRRTFENLTNKPEARGTSLNVSGNGIAAFSPSNIEAGVLPSRPTSKLKEAVETELKEQDIFGLGEDREMAIQARLEAIADRWANSSRRLTNKEKVQAQRREPHPLSAGPFSLLWMAIHQDHKSDVDYLLSSRNQNLHKRNGSSQVTVLHLAVFKRDLDLVRDILEKSSYTSPHTYINAGTIRSESALHMSVVNSFWDPPSPESERSCKTSEIFDLLSRYGANTNALDVGFRTPLHKLLLVANALEGFGVETVSITDMMDKLLQAGAEVNTKDMQGT